MHFELLIIGLLILLLWFLTNYFLLLILSFVVIILSAIPAKVQIMGGSGWADKLSLVDPKFNLREVAKQMILLEDHMFHKYKHCLDCISKHSLFIEGLLEEGLTMDKNNQHTVEITDILQKFRELMPMHIKKIQDATASDDDYTNVANQLRELRKPIAKKYAYYEAV